MKSSLIVTVFTLIMVFFSPCYVNVVIGCPFVWTPAVLLAFTYWNLRL